MPTVSNPVKISALYAAFFNRAPDAEGLAYWEAKFNEGQDLSDISAGFVQHEVFVSTYGSLDDQQFVEAIYTNMLGNAGDAGGISYWVSKLGEGMSRSDMVAQFVEDSLTLDLDAMLTAGDLTQAEYDVAVERQNYLTNRAEVGKNFAETLGDATLVTSSGIAVQQDPAYLASIAVLQGVDATQASVDAANQMIIDASFAEDPAAFINNASQVAAGTTFNLTEAAAAGADAMRLTGDMDVRIDLTANDNQVRGLDLDGNGTIAADGVENNDPTTLDDGKDFEIVDAYSRNKLNEGDLTSNFLGDIAYDGTGFEGDGVNTDGNIFLGGLGADTALGGIGNDFMVGGGVAQARVAQAFAAWVAAGNPANNFVAPSDTMYGGRNADFFFGELSLLDNTDGNALTIHGGSTSDDAAVGNNTPQDSDWLLLEVSDDEDGTTVNLFNENSQFVSTGVGRVISMTEIENVDASGNLYGFVNDVDVALGANGQNVNGENVGIGSTAQLAILGSAANNILIGGFDNDRIDGDDGNDLLFGGRLDYNNNPNIQNIVNDGRDELFGGAGDDHLVFEMDGGIYEGDSQLNANGGNNDTLWLTNLTFGTQSVNDLTTDGTVRLDLGTGLVGGLDNFAGYGGADAAPEDARADYTADQSNYVDGVQRTAVQDVENVIATGLGAVDYQAAGTNDPELSFNNQQNLHGVDADLSLRGTDGANILYANTGDDVIEGRQGNDMLSGGEGNDDFIFHLGSVFGGNEAVVSQDGVDVIHRQVDADGDGIWDTDAEGNFVYGADFGDQSNIVLSDSSLTLTLVNNANPASELANFPVDGVAFTLNGTTHQVTGAAADTYTEFAANLEAQMDAVAELADLTVVVNANNTLTIQDPAGGTFGELGFLWVNNITPPAGQLQWDMSVGAADVAMSQDRLIYAAYEDRADGELRDDDAVLGSNVSLGIEGYAEDLVIDFAEDGTRIAEDQAYELTFENLTTQDIVTITVNGVEFSLQVGVDLDGNIIGAEDGPFDAQAGIQAAFLQRLTDFINSFMDDDTAAGQVNAALAGNTITLTQVDYNGEETVFMREPTVAIDQLSGGERASVTVENTSQHEVHLFEFDGRDGNLNQDNVLFIGDTGESRAALQTAKDAGETLTGKNAVLIDNAADTHAATVANTGDVIADSQATNQWLDNAAQIYSVHGDDLLIGGEGNDTIMGGTGDDRIIGSLGEDTLDGGKNYYSVQVLGESEARVYELNAWEAANPAEVAALNGLTISSINVISQSETGVTLANGVFDDTLLFQQADFEAGQTEFTITLNDYNMNGSVVELQNDGAGTVDVDVDGDGLIDSTTTFTNFENIRTVSGVGAAVAGNGQGNDTLNVAALSTDAGGISYDLTNGGNAGEVKYSADAHASAVRPVAGDFESDVIRVDGVENVIAGSGNDLLLIDETEAAKNNTFVGGLGEDRIEYQNNYVGAPVTAEPTVTIKVNAEANTDTVTMTGGRVGSTVAVDTLESVEYITLAGNTATSSREDDVVDVTSMVTGAVVDYTNGEVRDLNGIVQVTIEGIEEMENVWADGDDTVIVADATTMNQNSRSDVVGDATDIQYATFLDFDTIDANADRVAFLNQTTGQISDTINQNQFTFDLSKTGTGNDTDRVDYSNANDAIAAIVDFNEGTANQFILVDSTDDQNFSDIDAGDRIDHLISVEEVTASTGDSVLDFTQSEQDLEITFTYDNSKEIAGLDRLESVIRIGDGNGDTIQGIPSYIEYYDLDENAGVAAFNNATWNQIEGSDNGETIIYQGSEDLVNEAGRDHRYTDDTLNLRGGVNVVNYSALETSITTVVNVVESGATDLTTTGRITANVTFQDGNGGALNNGGVSHTITSYTSDNDVAAGTLKIEASQDAEDTVEFVSGSDKLFILGTSAGVLDVQIGNLDAMRLTGFEIIQDAASDDVYRFESMITGMTYVDSGTADTDTIAVNNSAIGFDGLAGAQADDIDLGQLNGLGIDFDILDVTAVTAGSTDLVGTAGIQDETVILDDLSLFDSITAFEVIELAAGTSVNGNSFDWDLDANTLSDSVSTITVDNDDDTLDLSNLADAQTVVLTGTASATPTVIGTAQNDTLDASDVISGGVALNGGAGADTITGGAGNDIITGGAGADTLDGGVSTEVREVNIQGILESGTVDGTASIDFDGGAYVVTVSEGTEIVDGAGNDAVGAALATKINANLVALNAAVAWANGGELVSAVYSNDTDLLTFTFASGVDITEAIVASVGGAAGTLAVSAESVVTEGGEAGADTFVYEAASESTQASMDTINNFSFGAVDDVIDLSAIDANAVSAGDQAFAGVNIDIAAAANMAAVATAANTAFGANDIHVGVTGTDAYVFVDTNQSGTLDANDLTIKLAGVTDLTNFVVADNLVL